MITKWQIFFVKIWFAFLRERMWNKVVAQAAAKVTNILWYLIPITHNSLYEVSKKKKKKKSQFTFLQLYLKNDEVDIYLTSKWHLFYIFWPSLASTQCPKELHAPNWTKCSHIREKSEAQETIFPPLMSLAQTYMIVQWMRLKCSLAYIWGAVALKLLQ